MLRSNCLRLTINIWVNELEQERMAIRTKREDGMCDLFVQYLNRSEGTEYKALASNVKTDSGGKDFDYLLQSANGQLVALEIATLVDSDVQRSYRKCQKVMELVREYFENANLESSILIAVPFHIPYPINVIKHRLEQEQDRFLSAARVLGETPMWVETSIGSFELKRAGADDKNIMLHSYGGHMFPQYSVPYFSEMMQRLLPAKNKQLQYEAANRRVLLLCNVNGLANSIMAHSAITKAVSRFVDDYPSAVGNIDEIHVAFTPEEIHCVSPLSSSCPLLPDA